MGRAPCCDKANVKKGPWSPEEDIKLKVFIEKYGTGGNWIALPHKAGLKRCGKSCRLRWLNYLRPNIKHGEFSDDEDRIICSLFASIGSRWSIIAAQLPGRTDNDIKNYWNTKLKKKLLGVPPNSQRKTNQQHQHQHQQHQQLLFPSPAQSPSPSSSNPKPLFSGLDCFQPASADVFNNTAAALFHQGPPSSLNQYQISFGGPEQSCSSSDISYGNDQNMGFDRSYIYGGLGQQQLQAWGADQCPLIEYGYEEIKNLIGAAAASSTYTIDDPGSATAAGSFRAQGRGGGGEGMYQF